MQGNKIHNINFLFAVSVEKNLHLTFSCLIILLHIVNIMGTLYL